MVVLVLLLLLDGRHSVNVLDFVVAVLNLGGNFVVDLKNGLKKKKRKNNLISLPLFREKETAASEMLLTAGFIFEERKTGQSF